MIFVISSQQEKLDSVGGTICSGLSIAEELKS
jgi:hypothetical protein